LRPFRHLRSTVQSTRAPMFLLLTWHPNTSSWNMIGRTQEECKLRVGAPAVTVTRSEFLTCTPPPHEPPISSRYRKVTSETGYPFGSGSPQQVVFGLCPRTLQLAYLSQMIPSTSDWRPPPGTHLAAVRRRPHKCSSARASCKIQEARDLCADSQL